MNCFLICVIARSPPSFHDPLIKSEGMLDRGIHTLSWIVRSSRTMTTIYKSGFGACHDPPPSFHDPLIKSEGMLDAGVKPENDRINLF